MNLSILKWINIEKNIITKGEQMSKVNEVLNDPDHKCSFCGNTFPSLIEDDNTGNKYCSEKCIDMEEMVLRADCEQ